jgi:hypothetical protein
MSIAVRPADLEAEADQIVKLLAAYVNPCYDRARFEWLYRRNPDGVAQAWVAVNTVTGALVGTAAAVPRWVHVHERLILARALSDFCVADAYRALGPALQLQRACLGGQPGEDVTFCYDFPGSGMLAVYKRLRIEPFGQMRRLVYPLRIDAQAEALPLPSVLRQGIRVGGNALLGLRARRRRGNRHFTFSLLPDRCGAEFSALGARHGAEHGVSVRRSADYLNWRFLDNPFRRHEILTARGRSGELLAYAVLAPDANYPAIVDLFGPLEPGPVTAVASAALTLARSRRAMALTLTILESHPWVPALLAEGYRLREAHPVIFHASRIDAAELVPLAPSRCLLTQGDRDS